ncbi:MAG: (2Fe-2S) ferredoxin domain-containing protein [Oligoflexia bacterium]|nr:(2Fe-2S) ferredoxin domain-containing protein [Oligoflexia bacterium]
MRDSPTPWRHGVVLVCDNQRPQDASKPGCGRAQGRALRSWLKQAARQGGGPGAACRVLNSSCLGVCPEHGVAVALEPGDQIVVVDPATDRQALLDRVQAHMSKPHGR